MVFDPVIECIYGWGRVVRVYDDHLDMNGASYALVDLTAVYPTYYHVMGVSSARLELCFKYEKVTLRGIAAVENAQQIVSYLNAFCRPQKPNSSVPVLPTSFDRSQWAIEPAEEMRRTTASFSNRTEYAQETEVHSLVPVQERVTLAKPLRWQLIFQEQRQRRSKRLQAERARQEHGFDVEGLAMRLLDPMLPQVYVPTRLLPGEHAHYCTDATLCEEPSVGVVTHRYRIKDQGMLIFTDRRMIYIGRRRQIVLDYSRLVHISHLPGAIGVLSESWARREIFEVRLPLECTMYLDAILPRFQRHEHSNERAHTRVRQLYPSTQTQSFDTHTTTHSGAPETVTHWQYSDQANK